MLLYSQTNSSIYLRIAVSSLTTNNLTFGFQGPVQGDMLLDDTLALSLDKPIGAKRDINWAIFGYDGLGSMRQVTRHEVDRPLNQCELLGRGCIGGLMEYDPYGVVTRHEGARLDAPGLDSVYGYGKNCPSSRTCSTCTTTGAPSSEKRLTNSPSIRIIL
jgi:hypothetical protein